LASFPPVFAPHDSSSGAQSGMQERSLTQTQRGPFEVARQ
jgi:hypothetical protein